MPLCLRCGKSIKAENGLSKCTECGFDYKKDDLIFIFDLNEYDKKNVTLFCNSFVKPMSDSNAMSTRSAKKIKEDKSAENENFSDFNHNDNSSDFSKPDNPVEYAVESNSDNNKTSESKPYSYKPTPLKNLDLPEDFSKRLEDAIQKMDYDLSSAHNQFSSQDESLYAGYNSSSSTSKVSHRRAKRRTASEFFRHVRLRDYNWFKYVDFGTFVAMIIFIVVFWNFGYYADLKRPHESEAKDYWTGSDWAQTSGSFWENKLIENVVYEFYNTEDFQDKSLIIKDLPEKASVLATAKIVEVGVICGLCLSGLFITVILSSMGRLWKVIKSALVLIYFCFLYSYVYRGVQRYDCFLNVTLSKSGNNIVYLSYEVNFAAISICFIVLPLLYAVYHIVRHDTYFS